MRASSKIGYGIGQVSDGVKQTSFSVFLFFYYNQVLGLSGSLAGLAALLALVVDAITDPMVGQWSDRLKSRWGRRHPLMLIGALPFALAMWLLFSPPAGLSDGGLFAWMLGFAIAVRLLLTLYFVPHLSLGAEMVSDYHERTSLIGYRVFFSYSGALATSIIGFMFFFPPSQAFSNGMLDATSYPAFGLFAGVLGTVAMLWTVVATRKVIPHLTKPKPDVDARHPLLGFVTVFSTLKQRSFRILFSTTLMFMVLAGVTQTLLIYVATYLFGFEPEHLAFLASSAIIGIAAASPVAQWFSHRFDKKNTLAICVFIGSCIAFLPPILYLTGEFRPLPLNTRLMIVFIANGLSQAFFIAYVIMVDSMLTDTIDEHELKSDRREEGLFFAARSLATKASYGIGSFVAGIALDVIRFPRAADPQDVSSEALQSLAILAGPFSMMLFLATIAISSRYPLNAARHRLIQQTILERNTRAGPA